MKQQQLIMISRAEFPTKVYPSVRTSV